MATVTAPYDACVLHPATIRDLLMRLALADLYRAKWSRDIHDEWMRSILRTSLPGPARTRKRRRTQGEDWMGTLIELAPGVWQLPLLPLAGLNAYLVGDVVVDAGLPSSEQRLLKALAGRRVTAHVLTHAHPDHQGASAALCQARSVPLWCGVRDREATERAAFASRFHGPRRRLFEAAEWLGGPCHPVDRTLREGDAVADFEVIETPGHTPGHISLWREFDRVVVLGDVASHRNPLALRLGLRESSRLLAYDPAENRRSIRKIAALRPRLVCFGHGPPLADGDRFARWAEAL